MEAGVVGLTRRWLGGRTGNRELLPRKHTERGSRSRKTGWQENSVAGRLENRKIEDRKMVKRGHRTRYISGGSGPFPLYGGADSWQLPVLNLHGSFDSI